MDYRTEALNIQKEFIMLIDKEDFQGVEELLQKRKAFYISYSEYNSKELKEFLNSQEFKNSERKINLAFNVEKERIRKELDTLKTSRKVTRQYQNNVAHRNGFFNKKI